ncbi:MAG: thiosulfate oxidation carrier protein SoxY [Burkholderiales bacterium]|nr:thiosulfate oxidation carrier protein SoxY [Burkholderiales bacterium]
MLCTRRRFMGRSAAWIAALTAAGWLSPEAVNAARWDPALFASTTLEELVAALGGGPVEPSDAIAINAPEIAENGAVVPLAVTSRIPDTQSLSILVEKNPNLLAATFRFPEGTLAEVQTRVKMAQTSNVWILVRAAGGNFVAAKEIKVTLGGCGG